MGVRTLVFGAIMLALCAGAHAAPPPPDPDASEESDARRSDAELAERVLEQGLIQAPQGAFALPTVFHFGADVKIDRKTSTPRTLSLFGVDLNHHNCRPDAGVALLDACAANVPIELMRKRGVSFVYLKASEGAGFKDRSFAHFWTRLGALPADQHLPRGAYHFLRPNKPAEVQAANFLAQLEAVGALPLSPHDLPPVLDVEALKVPDIWADTSKADLIAMIRTWGEIVKEKTGRTPLLYTGAAFLISHKIGRAELENELAGYDIWIASYMSCMSNPTCEGVVNAPETYSNILYRGDDGKAVRERAVLWQFSTRGVIDPGLSDLGYACPATQECLDVIRFERPASQFYATFPGMEPHPVAPIAPTATAAH